MKVKSVRLTDELEKAVELVSKMEKIEASQSLRKIAKIGFEYYIARAYEKGRLTLREAAEMLNLTLIETLNLFLEIGITGNIDSKKTYECLKSWG
ncbi:MAG: hypothetical protein A2Y62_20790 [Candidatus Fischerbacteria bacterium RBG_13_37_8]|uniref:Uncharacterized protein n=1 Tax=Candidatus Fischerbacteria bacterium RBG_13_37_8 TaxID=1817863 RepID=A0A1F5VEU1_9BACT|nr:MAG: hypothetical protein A2Y62_20790 [Candidatus Fischerbacteria bacterium RBG_13_37_8]